MRRITMWIVATVCGLVLLFSYRTSTMGAPADRATAAAPPGVVANAPAGNAPTANAPPEDDDGAPGATPTPGGAGPSAAPGTAVPKTTDTVANGSVAQTRWGPVQVQVRIAGGKIIDTGTLQLPHGNRRDQEINSYAVPVLRKETLAAQSANIDTVSGATVTSDGYRQSLQAALDAAHFKA